MGETARQENGVTLETAFSILKRIVMGETGLPGRYGQRLSRFQYPQADRDG